jgi:hypothetical protein
MRRHEQPYTKWERFCVGQATRRLFFFENSKMIFVSFKKFWKIVDVVNGLLYQFVKSQFTKHSIPGYTKITKSKKFWRFEKATVPYFRSKNLLFLHRPE